jgi:hypothetical protein
MLKVSRVPDPTLIDLQLRTRLLKLGKLGEEFEGGKEGRKEGRKEGGALEEEPPAVGFHFKHWIMTPARSDLGIA